MRHALTVLVLLLIVGVLVPVRARLVSAESPVSGVYRANGQDARLAHAVAASHEDFNDQPAVTIVLTEKDTKGDRAAHIKASFGRLKTEGFTWADGEVSGRLTTNGEVSLFEETWQADLTFRVKEP